MAKLKQTELELNRDKDEMRPISVEFDFTQNALASVLYKQGSTVVLATAGSGTLDPSAAFTWIVACCARRP